MKKLLLISILLISINCHRIIGYKYSVGGFAVNAQGKAMLYTYNSEFLILANLPVWDDSLINRPLTVHGRLMYNRNMDDYNDESVFDSTQTTVLIRCVKYEFAK